MEFVSNGIESNRESIGKKSIRIYLNLSGNLVVAWNYFRRAISSKLVGNCRPVQNCKLFSLLSKTTLAVLLMERDV